MFQLMRREDLPLPAMECVLRQGFSCFWLQPLLRGRILKKTG